MNEQSLTDGSVSRGNKVALVLGSGGARGYAHIGVIEALEARGYEIISIAGCSMGALIGGIYASGKLPDYREWVCDLDYLDVLRLVDVTWSPMGAMRASKIMSKLEGLVGDTLMEDLPIPVTTVATDLVRQREVWFQNGPLLRAIRASIAVPGVITPVHLGDQVLVDGGLLNPLPMMPILAAHEADFVVAVNVTAHSPQPVSLEALLPKDENNDSRTTRERDRDANIGGWMDEVRATTRRLWSELGSSSEEEGEVDETMDLRGKREWGKLDMILESFDITQAALAKYKIAGYPPDILIEVPKTVCSTYEFHRAKDLIRLGRHLADEALARHVPDSASDAQESGVAE
ncbi:MULTISPECIES: patatin-like phospholipase family protein [Halomonadaceae]|jgi:NTE family protein|uniref:patatin-like phospholipase family protein n=1 Tax=Halomonadaceae TaxID=28256 RepID=UPI000A28AD4D|nr:MULTISPECIES: patatin-like phospholipase family protein [Halomonas]MCW4152458.1 patatin-like phospholipase family protein [Halomonas sp. 18H]MDR5886890.1 patatin-like phospholipase family protein [Halomonas janggokensis]QPL47365.1 patatin-like phospholipase family protein [Halomonas sp. A40-4]